VRSIDTAIDGMAARDLHTDGVLSEAILCLLCWGAGHCGSIAASA